MTIPATTPKVLYSGDDVTDEFPIPFIYWDASDIRAVVNIGGVETLWVLNTDYTLSGGNGATGTLTSTTPPATGTTLMIRSSRAAAQEVALPLGGPLPSTDIEQALDKVVRITQQLAEDVDRSVKVGETSALNNVTIPVPSAGKALLWNATEDALENSVDDLNGIVADATTQAGIATTQAGIATTQAGIATTQAGIATTQAANLPNATTAGGDKFLKTNTGGTAWEYLTGAQAAEAIGGANIVSAIGATAVQNATNVTGAATSAFALTADITPSQITANQNDYNPTGLSTANALRLSTDASRDVTGLAGGADGRLMIVHNVGSNALVLKDESASSTAANRFALGGADVTLAANQSVTLQYDSTSSRWRMIHMAGGVSIASTAEAQTGTNNTNAITPLRMREGLNASGSAPVYACRAWVNFNGTGTVAIRASGNVSSITDSGTGDYTVNFTTAMPDANYATLPSLEYGAYAPVIMVFTYTSSSVRLIAYADTLGASDRATVGVAIFR